MSRCFPFPPPGYEKKPTTDEPDLLKKEKRREKKHKKDKKDKEKKDGKEKREKDRSEGKHKEKKEKKDKHRDKKKDKEKGKTTSTPDDKKVHEQFEGQNGERPHQNNEQNNKAKSNSTDDKKSPVQVPYQNGDLVRNRIKFGGDAENNKFVQELDRRIRDEEKGMGSQQFVVDGRKNCFEVQKTDGRQAVTDMAVIGGNVAVPNSRLNGATMPPLDNKRIEKMQEKGSDDKRGDKRKNKDRDKQRQGGKDKDTEKEKSKEKKEKSKEKKAERDKNKHIIKQSDSGSNNFSKNSLENSFQGLSNEGNSKKRKDLETNGVSYENELRPNKMARSNSNISPENGRKLDFLQNPGSSLLDKQGASYGASPNSFKVGNKDGQRVNGMITSQPGLVSAKKPPISAINPTPCKPFPIKSPPVTANHVSIQSPPVPTSKPQLNYVAAQVITPKPPASHPNSIASHQLPPLSSTPPPSTTAKQPVSRPKPPPAVVAAVAVNKVATPPPVPVPKKKPPHPDTKYLNQILSVPKLDQWRGFDDQEWLYSSKAEPTSKKPAMEELEVQVWSEAKHIESVDVCALPYVIPY